MLVYSMVRPKKLSQIPEAMARAERLGYDGTTLLELTVPPTLSAAAGATGGNRAKAAMYLGLIPFMVDLVTHPEVNVGSAMNVFDDDGHLTHEGAMKGLEALMTNLKARL